MQGRQFVHVNADLIADLLRPDPASGGLVEEGIRCVGVINGKIAAQHVGHQGVDMAEAVGALIDLRQIALDPEYGGAGHGAGHRAVGGNLKEPLGADLFPKDLSLPGAAPVGVNNGIHQHIAILIKGGQTGTQAGDPDGLDFRGVYAVLTDQRAYASGERIPHIRGVDLNGNLIGIDKAVCGTLLGHKLGVLVDHSDLNAGGTDICAQEISFFHGDSSLVLQFLS